MIEIKYNELKQRHREMRESLPDHLSLRIHRALSWLDCAGRMNDDDARFIFLWISLNAAYANDFPNRNNFSEQKILSNFLNILLEVDEEKTLYQIVWQEFPTSIRLLIENEYVFQPFWEFQNNRISEAAWQEAFARAKQAAHRALGRMDTKKVLMIVFGRLYVLRNQLIHGGATWQGSVNRDQIRDGASILSRIIPAVVAIMLDKSPGLVGEPCYPVVKP